MKKLKSVMMAVALIAGLTSAFAATAPKANKFDDPIYHWPDNVNSDVAAAKLRFGCSGHSAACATGTLVSGQPGDPSTATINHNP